MFIKAKTDQKKIFIWLGKFLWKTAEFLILNSACNPFKVGGFQGIWQESSHPTPICSSVRLSSCRWQVYNWSTWRQFVSLTPPSGSLHRVLIQPWKTAGKHMNLIGCYTFPWKCYDIIILWEIYGKALEINLWNIYILIKNIVVFQFVSNFVPLKTNPCQSP